MMYNKAAGEGFKIYSLYEEDYLWDFVWTSPKHGISESIKVPGLTDTNSVIYNLYKQLPGGPNRYIVYTDNFFTSVDLFSALRDISIGAISTTKTGSYPTELLALNKPSKNQKTWGLQAMMSSKRIKPPGPEDIYKSRPRKGLIRDKINQKKRMQEKGPDQILHIAFQDQSLVQLLTTVHSISEASNVYEIKRNKRAGIALFDNSKEDSPMLEFSTIAHEHNLYMGGSDGNAQVRANYQSKIKARRWPWSLTVCLLLAGSVYNAFHIYKLIHTDEIGQRMAHSEFQHQMAIKLLQDPELFSRKKASSISISSTANAFTMPSIHRLIKISKKGYCVTCKTTGERPAKRQPLGELDNFRYQRRKRGSQS